VDCHLTNFSIDDPKTEAKDEIFIQSEERSLDDICTFDQKTMQAEKQLLAAEKVLTNYAAALSNPSVSQEARSMMNKEKLKLESTIRLEMREAVGLHVRAYEKGSQLAERLRDADHEDAVADLSPSSANVSFLTLLFHTLLISPTLQDYGYAKRSLESELSFDLSLPGSELGISEWPKSRARQSRLAAYCFIDMSNCRPTIPNG